MLKLEDIERVNEILDEEIAVAEIRKHDKTLEKMMFVQEQFREACLQCAKAEGLITSKTGGKKS